VIILLISTEIETKWNPKTKKYYESLGYKYTKIGDSFFVKVSDLKDGSNERVLCKCDYCGEIFDIVWHSYITLKKKKNNKDCCGNPKCTGLKAEESMLMLHGVRNARELESTNEKIKQTNLKKYGCENPFGNKDVQRKIAETNIEKYGVSVPTKSEEIKEKSKQTCLEKYGASSYLAYYSITHKGELNPKWKGGVDYHRVERATDGYRVWRKAVFDRDHYTCQCCGNISSKGNAVELHAHHLLNWKDNIDARYDISNGITLCDKCHYEFHSKYGKSNNTKEQFDEFINMMKKVC